MWKINSLSKFSVDTVKYNAVMTDAVMQDFKEWII